MSDTTEELDLPTPSQADDLAKAKDVIAGPVPTITEQPDTVVMLPQGFRSSGVYQQKAEVRELTGADEEVLARTKEFVDFFDTMVAVGTVRIGDFDMSDFNVTERKQALQTLLLGERERLLLAIIQATYGDTKTMAYVCAQCNTEQEFDLVLSEDLKVIEVDDIRPSYTYTTTKGDLIEFRLVNGADQNEALQRSATNPAEQNTTLLSRCITKVNEGLVPDPIGFARHLPVRDRRALLKELTDHQPGVDMEVIAACVRCQNEQRLPLGWGDLFPS